MKILITGGAGFVGSNFTRALVLDGIRPILIIRRSTDLWRINDILSKVDVIVSDISDRKKLEEETSNIKKLEYIYHLASNLNQDGRLADSTIINDNIIGTYNLLNLAYKYGSKFIYTGSCFEYKENEIPYTEDSPLEAKNIYSASKISSTFLTQAFSKQYKVDSVVLRLFTPYGYFENIKRIIPYIIINLFNDKKITLNEKKNSRDFIFIEDLVALLKMILNMKMLNGEIYNVGTEEQHSTEDIVSIVQDILKKKVTVDWLGNKSIYEYENWKSNCEKIREHLGWQAKTDFKTGVLKTCEWMRKYYRL